MVPTCLPKARDVCLGSGPVGFGPFGPKPNRPRLGDTTWVCGHHPRMVRMVNSFKWFLIFCRNKFQRFLKGNVSKISLKPNLEIFEKISLFKKSLKLVSMKYQISLKSFNQLLQSFNNQKVIFSNCEIFKLWDFQNVRFSKCAIFTKIAHFDKNRTKNVRFSPKCAIFVKIAYFENLTFWKSHNLKISQF